MDNDNIFLNELSVEIYDNEYGITTSKIIKTLIKDLSLFFMLSVALLSFTCFFLSPNETNSNFLSKLINNSEFPSFLETINKKKRYLKDINKSKNYIKELIIKSVNMKYFEGNWYINSLDQDNSKFGNNGKMFLEIYYNNNDYPNSVLILLRLTKGEFINHSSKYY